MSDSKESRPRRDLVNCARMRIRPIACLAILLVAAFSQPAHSIPLLTYITGGTPVHGQVIFRAVFDSAIADSAVLSVAAIEPITGLRLDNIDFVPGSGFSEVVVTAQSPGNGALTRYNVITGAKLPDVIPSTNAVAVPPPSGVSRPASIVPNPAGTHYYYNENQFGFAGATHRMMRVPVAGGGGEEVVFDGTAGGGTLAEFSGVEIVGGRMYFFAHDTAGPAGDRQLYSVALGPGGLALGGATLEVFGLDRSGSGGPGPGSSDGSDELDFDPSTGLLYGTNIGTGEVIGFDPATGPPIGVGALPFYIDPVLITASAAISTDVGLGLLSGTVTLGAAGPVRQIDGIRPDGAGHLVVMGHNGVMVSIDISGVLGNGADDGDIIRLFNRDIPTAGFTVGFGRSDISFDDHTILAPAVPEPSTFSSAALGLLVLAWFSRRRKR